MNLEKEISQVHNVTLEVYPFKHFLIEDYLDKHFLGIIKKDLIEVEKSSPTKIFESPFGMKKEWKNFKENYSGISEFLKLVSSDDFIQALKYKFDLTNSNLDFDFSFDGGGYVVSPPNSFLGYHADFNFSSNMNKYRILNILFYVNENYIPEFGGNLHLLDAESKTVEKSISPKENSILAFLTDDVSIHGVSKNRQNFHRRSFNFYYYSDVPISKNQSTSPHRTLWV